MTLIKEYKERMKQLKKGAAEIYLGEKEQIASIIKAHKPTKQIKPCSNL